MRRTRGPACLAFTLALLAVAPVHAQVTFRYLYDPNGQLIRAVDSSGNVIEYDYDSNGNPTGIQRSTVAPGSLAIFNVIPPAGQAGQSISIFGQNFSTTPANNIVKFNGTVAVVLSATATQLVVAAPAGVTSGAITVTVGSTTATYNLNFTVPPPPAITSITPNYASLGQRLTVNVQGANFSAATLFNLPGAGYVSNIVVTGTTQATMNLTTMSNIGTGYYVMTADNNGVLSSPIPSTGNSVLVLFPAGGNTVDLKFSTYNAAYPATSSLTIPPGSNEADRQFSTFNGAYPAPTFVVPGGSNEADRRFSTFNGAYLSRSSLQVPSGSNEVFQLFSAQNSAGGLPSVPLSIHRDSSRAASLSKVPAFAVDARASSSVLMAGETLEIPIGSPAFRLKSLDFDVNGVPLVSSHSASANIWFTVPYGVETLELTAVARTETGMESEPISRQVTVAPDPGGTVSGRVVDNNGQPLAGAAVSWEAHGLVAEYYRLNQFPASVPDLAGLTPARTGYVSALNYPNPREVFGKDPMGIGLGRSYAARFHGSLVIDAPGTYQFHLYAHSGARLSLDGRTVATTSEGSAQTELAAGTHEIEVVYYGDEGASSLQLTWIKPGGSEEAVPPGVLRCEALPGWTGVTGGDGRFALRVPAALDGVSVRVFGNGSVEVNQ